MQPAKHVVVLPTYNEKENLERIVRAISDLRVERLRILVVDDHSPDGTGEIAEQLAEHFPVDVLHREGKLGLGSAYLRGFQEALVAGAQTVFEMDSDFSHDPKMIPVFLDAVEKRRGCRDWIAPRPWREGGRMVVGTKIDERRCNAVFAFCWD